MAQSKPSNNVFTIKDVQVLDKKTPFKDYFEVDKYTFKHPRYDGSISQSFTREIFERGHAVATIPYDPVLDRLILIEQFRPGAFAANYNPWLMEIPAGIIEEGQTPLDVAKRETLEETGCHAKRIEFVSDFLVTPGASSESIHLFCVEIDSNEASEMAGLEHEAEDIKVLNISIDEALSALDEGKIHNLTAMYALYWFRFNRNNIRKKWCE